MIAFYGIMDRWKSGFFCVMKNFGFMKLTLNKDSFILLTVILNFQHLNYEYYTQMYMFGSYCPFYLFIVHFKAFDKLFSI